MSHSSRLLASIRESPLGEAITAQDTIIQRVTDPHFQCPTCGKEFNNAPIPFTASSFCPGCNQEVELAQGKVPYRTLSGNMKRHNGLAGGDTYA